MHINVWLVPDKKKKKKGEEAVFTYCAAEGGVFGAVFFVAR